MLFSTPPVKNEGYRYEAPPSPWTRVDAGTADVAFKFPSDGTTISVNSVCGQYQDRSLEELTKDLVLGLTDPHVLRSAPLMVDKVPALDTTFTGRDQEIAVTISVTIVRTTTCVYDFLLASRAPTFDQHWDAYNAFVQTFHEGSAP